MKKLFILTILGVVYYLVAISGMAIFSFQPSNITPLWLPFAFDPATLNHT